MSSLLHLGIDLLKGKNMSKNIVLEEIDITPLLKAKKKLDQALQIARSDLEKTGAIKCFEYCYELSWKVMRKILLKKGIETASPRDAFREAALNKLITDPEIWFEFIKQRNLSTHTYNEELAEELFLSLPKFQNEMNMFIHTIELL